MPSYYARDEYTASAGQTDFTVTFPYINSTHVIVTVNSTVKAVTTDYTWFNASTIRFNSGLTGGETVVIRRETSRSVRLVDFQDAGNLTEADLDTDSNQTFYLSQEVLDNLEERMGQTLTLQWDADGKRITDVADPVDLQDVVTRNYLNTSLVGSGNVPTPTNPTDNDKVLTASAGAWSWGSTATKLKSGRKNLLINGCFRVWQRATSQSSSGYGSADRWINYNSISTMTTSRQTFTAGQTDVPGEPRYYIRHVTTTGGTAASATVMTQRIEDVRTAAGQTVTLSFWAKADAAKNIAVEFIQYFGAFGSTVITGIGAQKVALTTSWTRYTVTVDIPSISGKTIDDSTGDHYLSCNIWLEGGSDFTARNASLGTQSGTFEFSNIQLEVGDAVTDFEYRPIGEEIHLCQRYYQKSYAIDTVPGTNTITNITALPQTYINATTPAASSVIFPVPMRGATTITAYLPSGTSGQLGMYDYTGSENVTASIIYNGNAGFNIGPATISGKTGGYSGLAYFHWTADSEL